MMGEWVSSAPEGTVSCPKCDAAPLTTEQKRRAMRIRCRCPLCRGTGQVTEKAARAFKLIGGVVGGYWLEELERAR